MADSLSVGQLESLRFKCDQIIDSITALQRIIDLGGVAAMPPWPDILAKYNLLVSQTHNFSTSLLANAHQSQNPKMNGTSTSFASQPPLNPFQRLALFPASAVSDAQLDNELIPLIRNQQTTQVLRVESDIVRRIAERMTSRGSLGLHQANPFGAPSDETEERYQEVLKEAEEIKKDHDSRAERALRAVTMLKEKFDWRARVAVDQEEPEELEWDPRLGGPPAEAQISGVEDGMSEGDEDSPMDDEEEDANDEEDGADERDIAMTFGGAPALVPMDFGIEGVVNGASGDNDMNGIPLPVSADEGDSDEDGDLEDVLQAVMTPGTGAE